MIRYILDSGAVLTFEMTEHLTVGHVKLSHNKNEIAYLIQEALSKLQILQPLLVNCIHLCEFGLNGSFL